MKKLIFLPVIVLSLLILSFESQANVIVDDADSNAVSEPNVAFTFAIVPTGSGLEGDFELIACGVSATVPGTTFFALRPAHGKPLNWAIAEEAVFAGMEYGGDSRTIQLQKTSLAAGTPRLLFLPLGLSDTTR